MKYIDTNVIIHHLLGDKRIGNAAGEYLKRIARGEVDACASVHVVTEVYAFLKGTGKNERTISEVLSLIMSYGIKWLPLTPSVIMKVPERMEAGWKYGDAIHYLTMKEEGIAEIVTDDKFFDNLDVKRVNLLE